MEQFQFLQIVVTALEKHEIPYLIVGSMATIFYGEPRFTNDIDVVAHVSAGKVPDFCREFPATDFYVSVAAAHTAVTAGGQFNIIHPESGLKVDIITPIDDDFTRSELSRRVRRVADSQLGFEADFGSIEDVILKKVEFYLEGGSEKHLRDIAGVVKMNGTHIDWQYIEGWATKLGLLDAWQAIITRVAESKG